MAEPIEYTPGPVTTDTARDEVDDLVTALHETGLLRALGGAVQAYPDLTTALVKRIPPETVRSVARLGSLVRLPEPGQSDAVVAGLRSAVAAANEALSGEPPSWFDLVRKVGSADVRRGLGAAVAALGAFGREVGRRDT